ncbi:MAG: GyrI-like domain-containing protein [Saprospiraceae bacterium]|nr:GyrI-like domain-containing protein [Saprospiraceae bacterium]
MQSTITTLSAKKLVGKHLTMSLANNLTGQLWGSFMPRRQEVQNAIGTDLYSLQVYPTGHFERFAPQNEFVKWALVEVTDFENIPEGMEGFELPGGLYAVFPHRGMDTSIFQYIYGVWLPQSGYQLDERPHFELLGERYKQGSPESEEDIWVPIRR